MDAPTVQLGHRLARYLSDVLGASVAKSSKEVALVAVHEVADQGPKETAKSIVDLLVSFALDGVRYQATVSTKLTLPVAPLDPQSAATRRASASVSSSDRGLWRSLWQSPLSDIHHPKHPWEIAALTLEEAKPVVVATSRRCGVIYPTSFAAYKARSDAPATLSSTDAQNQRSSLCDSRSPRLATYCPVLPSERSGRHS